MPFTTDEEIALLRKLLELEYTHYMELAIHYAQDMGNIEEVWRVMPSHHKPTNWKLLQVLKNWETNQDYIRTLRDEGEKK